MDVGSEAGIDSLIAAKMVGDTGGVVGVDMTLQKRERARTAAEAANFGTKGIIFRARKP